MKKDNWKKGERNNVTIALNVLYNKKEKINPGYVSKNILCHEKQVIFLMIPNGEGCAAKSKRTHYLAIKKLSILLWEIISKNHGDFYCLNCLHSFRTKNKLEPHKKWKCEHKAFCNYDIMW